VIVGTRGSLLTAGDARTSEARPPHVLVIDDAAELLDLFVDLLEGEGYRVSTSRALLSIDDIGAMAPDVIVHDLIFSSYDDVLRMLTLRQRAPRLVPVILCTADIRVVSDHGIAAQLENLGVPVILKPFAIEALLNVVAETLARQTPSAQNGHVSPQHSIGHGAEPGNTRSAS
jgi:CheY-like chemotaxis protein